MDATIYKPEVAFRTKAKNVVQVTPETVENPATYSLTVKPIDVTELGASPIQVAIGDYVMDFIGTPYRITNVEVIEIPDPVTGGLLLTWDDIVNVPVVDASSVADWNTFFDLPTFGTPFSSVVIDGNKVNLIGGSGITLAMDLFRNNSNLLKFEDNSNCVIVIGYRSFRDCLTLNTLTLPVVTLMEALAFYGCTSLTSVSLPLLEQADGVGFGGCTSLTNISLPSLITISSSSFFEGCTLLSSVSLPVLQSMQLQGFKDCTSLAAILLPSITDIYLNNFYGCTELTNISIPSCTNLGGDTLENGVFALISGNIITLTVPAALMTCNAGNPDGDIQYLQANNTVTVITV